MESYHQRKEKDLTQKRYPTHKVEVNIDNKRPNHVSKVSYSSRYNTNSKLISTKNQTNPIKKEIEKEYKTINNYNLKKDYDFSHISKNEEPDNSNKKIEKKLTLFNLSTRTYELSDATVSSDGVLRGYNDNCSFYVSGTGNAKPKLVADNKYKNKTKNNSQNFNNNINNYKRENRVNRQNRIYESKTQVLNPSDYNDYKKRDIPKDNKNKYISKYDNKYKKNNYNTKTIVNTSLYNSDNTSKSNNINKSNNITNINKISNINIIKDSFKDNYKDNFKDIFKDNFKDNYKDNIKDNVKDNVKDNIKDNNKEKKSYLIPTASKKTTRKLEDLPKYSYLRRSYFETEPNNNIKHYNQKTVITESINQPLLSSISVINKEEKPAITSVQTIDPDLNNIINNIRKRIYKTSTNTNFEEKNKNNYYKTIVDKKPYQSKKRNTTPNKSSNLKNINSYNISSLLNNTFSENNSPEKKSIRNFYKSVIPHSKDYRYRKIKGKEKEKEKEKPKEVNILSNIEKKYQPLYPLNKQNSISKINSNITPNINITTDYNSIVNKSRYNFPERPKLRKYGTQTEFHSVDKNKYDSRTIINSVRDKIFEVPTKKFNITTNYKIDVKKYENKNRYQPRAFSITSSLKPERKFNVKTEIVPRTRSFSRSNEFEVTDIAEYRKRLRDKEEKKETSTIDNNLSSIPIPTVPKLLEPISLLKKNDNLFKIDDSLFKTDDSLLKKDDNLLKKDESKMKKDDSKKKIYTSFERSLQNIKDNENEIKKEEKEKESTKNRRNMSKNHFIFESNDTSRNKYLFKTSTLRQENRPHGLSLSEYEVPIDKYLKYKKIEEDKNELSDRNNRTDNIFKNINKNNYFNAMKNLEEEIEVDDENEQVEYLPPKSLTRERNKTKEERFIYSINKSPMEKKDNKYSYLLNKDKKEENKYSYLLNKDKKEENKYSYLLNKDKKEENKYSYLYNKDKKEDKNDEIENKYISNINDNKEKDLIRDIKNNNNIINTNITKPKINVNYFESSNLVNLGKNITPSINISKSDKESEIIKPNLNIIKNQYLITNKTKEQKSKTKTTLVPQNIQQKPIKLLPPQQIPVMYEKQHEQIEIQKEQLNIPQLKPQNNITTQQLEIMHQEHEAIIPDKNEKEKKENEEKEEKNEKEKEKEIEDFQNSEENNTLRKSKYSSYFGDSNNNYIEIKGYSGSKENDNENEEEEENENENENDNDENENENDNDNDYDQNIQLERSVTFGIQSENLCVPAEREQEKEDKENGKEDKEADEQEVEEDEQNDENYDNRKNNYGNNNENEDEGGELVGDEMDVNEEYEDNENENDNDNEDNDDNDNENDNENDAEGEEIEENIIEENNGNEEEEVNDNEYEDN